MNTEWHNQNVMPKRASREARIEWHRAHQDHCACRPVPASLRADVQVKAVRRPTSKTRASAVEGGAVDPKFAPLVAAFARDRSVTHGGKGFGSSGLKVLGKLFAMVSSKGKFVVKLPKARVAEMVKRGDGEFFDPGHGRLMKEWIAVDTPPATWLALAKEAREFVQPK